MFYDYNIKIILRALLRIIQEIMKVMLIYQFYQLRNQNIEVKAKY